MLGRDLRSGSLKELEYYQRRFEGHAELVADQYRLACAARDLLVSGADSTAGPLPIQAASAPSLEGKLKHLAEPVQRGARYAREGEIAHGGMGIVYKVRDKDLDRTLALKEMSEEAATRTPLARARFLEEAQVTAQLDHPGIVPVHEVGVGSDGRLFFAMKLVRGRNLLRVLELMERGEEGWTLPRLLGVLLKVCEAVGYAHSKGVIHRDLKPSNVMVGNYGETYVMDWGLARILGRPDLHDLRITEETHTKSLHTLRREEREKEAPSPLLTRDGDVIGTPAYMSPEQARGELERLSPRTDIYSIGAILYHALSGQAPYLVSNARLRAEAVLWRLIEGPPTPIARLRAGVPGELVAICERAMARNPEDRYGDMEALAEDLRAFTEGRVVQAYETGAWAELTKWVGRNRAFAGALIASVAALLVLVFTSSAFYVEASENRLLTSQLDREESHRIEESRRLRLVHDCRQLVLDADRLWPVDAGLVEAYEAWLACAGELVAQVRRYQDQDASQPHAFPGAIDEDLWWGEVLPNLGEEVDRLCDPSTGLFSAGVSVTDGWGVARRAAVARRLREKAAVDRRWEEALASIRDPLACPIYAGLEIAPQPGMIPIGRDPVSGLWEFAHLALGEAPVRDSQGKLQPTEETGLVFVLVPGGASWLGAQKSDPDGRNYDPRAKDNEGPVHLVYLSPFLLSKYELNQAQWIRLCGTNPSFSSEGFYQSSWDREGRPWSGLMPVETVSWLRCRAALARIGLDLPTEAQWEYAIRAWTDTPWWIGSHGLSLRYVCNLDGDRFDSSQVTTPVGVFWPNGFGLHDMLGNVMEWCLDSQGDYPEVASEDPVHETDAPEKIARGGSWAVGIGAARSASREVVKYDFDGRQIGVRPACVLVR